MLHIVPDTFQANVTIKCTNIHRYIYIYIDYLLFIEIRPFNESHLFEKSTRPMIST